MLVSVASAFFNCVQQDADSADCGQDTADGPPPETSIGVDSEIHFFVFTPTPQKNLGTLNRTNKKEFELICSSRFWNQRSHQSAASSTKSAESASCCKKNPQNLRPNSAKPAIIFESGCSSLRAQTKNATPARCRVLRSGTSSRTIDQQAPPEPRR